MTKRGLWLVAGLALVAGCRDEAAEPQQAAQTFHEVMKDEIDVRADVVWAVGNAAIGDKAGIDPAKMSEADWTRLAEGATSLRQAALKLVRMDPLVIAPPGVKIADEGIPGGHSASAVQARLDQDPAKVHQMADALAIHAGDLAAAARAHDAARAGLLVDQLDSVCESCHLEFWYPDQKALVEDILGSPS